MAVTVAIVIVAVTVAVVIVAVIVVVIVLQLLMVHPYLPDLPLSEHFSNPTQLQHLSQR